jgi:hypothetical protein
MHSGEEWFTLGAKEYIALGVLLAVYLILALSRRLPSMSGFKDFTDTINTAGGHLVLLLLMIAMAVKVTFQLFYHTLGLLLESPDAKISVVQAVINQMLTFCTTTLIMLPLGAFIKGMTGGKATNGNGGTNGGGIVQAPVVPDAPAITSKTFAGTPAPSIPAAATNTGSPP